MIDYRPAGIAALEYALRTEDVAEFAGEFGTTAFVLIYQDGESYRVELRDIPAGGPSDPPQQLWLVNGLDDSLPTYDYRICELAAPDEEHFACLAVYDIPRWHKPRRRSSKVVRPAPAWNAGRGLRMPESVP